MELTYPFSTPVFYSANLGPDEPVRPISTKQNGVTVLFTDKDVTPEQAAGWDQIVRVEASQLSVTPRRAARRLKMMPHKLFPLAPISIWFDATNDPSVNLIQLCHQLGLSDIACFRHPDRHTAREEAEICKRLKLDSDISINGLLSWFERVSFPDSNGLYVTSCLVRRHTPQIAALNELWQWAIDRWSQRDQISFPWVLWHTGITPVCIPGKPRDDNAGAGVETAPNPYFKVTVWQ